ncbi:unnamed protein product, partial [Amoebophrya sp. A25]|eukprot:GSA25T00024986001.1
MDDLAREAGGNAQRRDHLLKLFRMRVQYYWVTACGYRPMDRDAADKPKDHDWYDEAVYYGDEVAGKFFTMIRHRHLRDDGGRV